MRADPLPTYIGTEYRVAARVTGSTSSTDPRPWALPFESSTPSPISQRHPNQQVEEGFLQLDLLHIHISLRFCRVEAMEGSGVKPPPDAEKGQAEERSIHDPLYLPYRRLDLYGDFKSRPIRPLELTRIAVFAVFILPLKFLVTISGMLTAYLASMVSSVTCL